MTSKHPEAQWFEDAKLGLFLHWGIYSVRGVEASWPLQPWWPDHIPYQEYEALAHEFKPDKYDAKEWARIAKDSGVKYAVLTTKHVDGYCMFDTQTTDYCATKTGPGRDLIRPYIEAFREAGIKVGLYIGLIDWHDEDCATIPLPDYCKSPKPFEYSPDRFNKFHMRFMEQVRELLTNYGRIDLVWFDGAADWTADRWRSHEVYRMMINLQPHLVVNNRIPGIGDYATPEQHVPLIPPEGPWETCLTMNNAWGYHPDPNGCKNVRDLIRTITVTASKGGNLLLNIGPKPDGTLPAEAVERFMEIGKWLSYSGEAIYGVKRGPHSSCFYGPMTRKGKTLYLHVFDIPRGSLKIHGINGIVKQARLLRTGEALETKSEIVDLDFGVNFVNQIEIELSAEQCDPWNTVIAVDFEEGLIWPENK